MSKNNGTFFSIQPISFVKFFFILIIPFFSLSAYADTQVFNTPYFSIPLTKSMQQIANDDIQANNAIQHMYVYGANYPDAETSLTINVIPVSKNQESDKQQRQLIAGMVHGFNKDSGQASSPINQIETDSKIQTVQLKNREFKSYTLNYKSGVIKIFTTTNNNNIYTFAIACYGDEAKKLNEYVDQITNQISEVNLK